MELDKFLSPNMWKIIIMIVLAVIALGIIDPPTFPIYDSGSLRLDSFKNFINHVESIDPRAREIDIIINTLIFFFVICAFYLLACAIFYYFEKWKKR